MDRHVPFAPKLIDRFGIPPVFVELSVSKARQFGNEVGNGMEIKVEANEPYAMVRYLPTKRTSI